MKMAPIGSEGVLLCKKTKTHGFAGIGMALLMKMYHYGRALRFQNLKPGPVSPSLTASF